MRITLTVENFKSIKSTDLHLSKGVNILIGPNGSGKSTLLASLRFIRDTLIQGAGLAMAKGGGPARHYRRGTDTISFTLRGSYGNRTYRRRRHAASFCWTFQIAQRGPDKIATVVRESLTITVTPQRNESPVPLFSMVVERDDASQSRPTPDLKTHPDVGADLFGDVQQPSKAKAAKIKDVSDRMTQVARHVEPDRLLFPFLASFDRRLADVSALFINLNEYNIVPDVARQPTDQLPFAELLPNGKNLSEVIHALANEQYHRLATSTALLDSGWTYAPRYYRHDILFPSPNYLYQFGRRFTFQDIGDALANINTELATAVKPLSSVSVDLDRTNGRRFVTFSTDAGVSFYPDEVSDGTIKWLCILVSLFVPFSRVYLLEEPENFLHPWMQQKLLSLMRAQAEKHGTIFFLTSHSATVLNSATPKEVVTVKATRDGTKAAAFSEEADIQRVLNESDFGLGDLWVSGAIGAVPSEHD